MTWPGRGGPAPTGPGTRAAQPAVPVAELPDLVTRYVTVVPLQKWKDAAGTVKVGGGQRARGLARRDRADRAGRPDRRLLGRLRGEHLAGRLHRDRDGQEHRHHRDRRVEVGIRLPYLRPEGRSGLVGHLEAGRQRA